MLSKTAVFALLLAAVPHLQAADGIPEDPAARREVELVVWMFHTAKYLDIPQKTVALIANSRWSRKVRLYDFADMIVRDDKRLIRYVARLQTNLKRNGRLSAIDKKALRLMYRLIEDKRDAVKFFKKFFKKAGVKKPKADKSKHSTSTLSDAKQESRYNPATGLWERYESEVWTPLDPQPE